jgi:hypothetical protein
LLEWNIIILKIFVNLFLMLLSNTPTACGGVVDLAKRIGHSKNGFIADLMFPTRHFFIILIADTPQPSG